MRVVLQRELLVASRRAVSYWGRFTAAAIGIFILWQFSAAVASGAEIFIAAAWLGIFLCTLDGARRASASIAEEKADGTLGLLFLTKLSGREFVVGKFVSALIGALPMALALFPIFGVCVLLGGVSGGEFLRATIAVLHMLLIAIAIGVLVSATATDAMPAFFITCAIIVVGSVMAGILSGERALRVVNPLTPLIDIRDVNFLSEPSAYWLSLLISQSVIFGGLWLFGRNFIRNWRTEQESQVRWETYVIVPAYVDAPTPKAVESQPATKTQPRYYGAFGTPKWFDMHPITWLTIRECGLQCGTMPLVIAAILAVAGGFVFIGFPIMFAFGLVIALCIASSRTFAVARQSNSMELLITTPLGINGVVKGHRAGLRKLFFWPGVISVVGFLAWILREKNVTQYGVSSDAMIIAMYLWAGYALMLIATPWIGMWMGLRAKTPGRAVLTTLGLVLLVPRLGFCMMIDPIYFAILWVVAQDAVRRGFRRLVSERYTPV